VNTLASVWKRSARTVVRVAVLGLVLGLCVGTPDTAVGVWQQFLADDGLPSDFIFAICEDGRGVLWFGGYGGVSSFDGIRWETYDEIGGRVTTVLAVRDGSIWVGTDGNGLFRFDGQSWFSYGVDDGLPSERVYCAVEGDSGEVWFGTGGGAAHFDGSAWTTYTESDGLAHSYVLSMLQDTAGNVWFGTHQGVTLYDGTGWQSYSVPHGLPFIQVDSMFEDRFGCVWAGGYGGVSCYDGSGWTSYTTADGLVSGWVRAIAEDEQGRMWFGTSSGLSCFDGATWRSYGASEGLACEDVCNLTKDTCGNLWISHGFPGNGATRHDYTSWTTLPPGSGLPDGAVMSILEHPVGRMWFGTDGGGVCMYENGQWRTWTTADGLAHDNVRGSVVDGSGMLWFGTLGGLSSFDGSGWENYTISDGLPADHVWGLEVGSSGDLWVGTLCGGVGRYDGNDWIVYTEEDGLVDDCIYCVQEDNRGDLWFGSCGSGVSSFDGYEWTTYTEADGLAMDFVYDICEDSRGVLWFSTTFGISQFDGSAWTTLPQYGAICIEEDRQGRIWVGHRWGVWRYDGEHWASYGTDDGLVHGNVMSIHEGQSGQLWFGSSGGGVTIHEPDGVAPQTLVYPEPPHLFLDSAPTVAVVGAYGETAGIYVSGSLDGGSWSEWSQAHYWAGAGLADGEYLLRLRARDESWNIDPTPAEVHITVDATPPMAVILDPPYGGAVQDSIAVIGTANDLRFDSYRLEVRPVPPGAPVVLTESQTPVTEGFLGGWDTTLAQDAEYDIMLAVSDTLGRTGVSMVRVEVDNELPGASETSPVLITATEGGDVSSIDGGLHLYFPPKGLARAVTVSIDPAGAGSVPDTLPCGASLLAEGYDVDWEGVAPEKPLIAEFRLEADAGDTVRLGSPALYVGTGSQWKRVGGTYDPARRVVSATTLLEGSYALFTDSGGSELVYGLSGLTVTPRAFSPRGSFARDEAAIGFTLGRGGKVTAKVYNRAGRIVRALASGRLMAAGVNVLWWDGRDRDGSCAPDGLYIVTVEAGGETRTATLAVVR